MVEVINVVDGFEFVEGLWGEGLDGIFGWELEDVGLLLSNGGGWVVLEVYFDVLDFEFEYGVCVGFDLVENVDILGGGFVEGWGGNGEEGVGVEGVDVVDVDVGWGCLYFESVWVYGNDDYRRLEFGGSGGFSGGVEKESFE